MEDELRIPTADDWAQTLMDGIGFYGAFPEDHPEVWPQIRELLQRHGYTLNLYDGNWYARRTIS